VKQAHVDGMRKRDMNLCFVSSFTDSVSPSPYLFCLPSVVVPCDRAVLVGGGGSVRADVRRGGKRRGGSGG
jgi:hypothetical protein